MIQVIFPAYQHFLLVFSGKATHQSVWIWLRSDRKSEERGRQQKKKERMKEKELKERVISWRVSGSLGQSIRLDGRGECVASGRRCATRRRFIGGGPEAIGARPR